MSKTLAYKFVYILAFSYNLFHQKLIQYRYMSFFYTINSKLIPNFRNFIKQGDRNPLIKDHILVRPKKQLATLLDVSVFHF